MTVPDGAQGITEIPVQSIAKAGPALDPATAALRAGWRGQRSRAGTPVPEEAPPAA